MNGTSGRRRARAVEIVEWWWGLRTLPETRRTLVAETLISAAALLAACLVLASVTEPVRTPPPPPRLPSEAADDLDKRFGVTLVDRRIIFSEVVAVEPDALARGRQNFPGEPWSVEDDRAAAERDVVRGMAERRGINVSVLYAILDEGIRSKWPGRDGAPIEGRVVPLKPRRR